MISNATLLGVVDAKIPSLSKKGLPVLSFIVITKRLYRDSFDKTNYQVSRHTVNVYGRMLKFADEIKEGDIVFVEGNILHSPDDQGHYFYYIKAKEIRKVTKEDSYE